MLAFNVFQLSVHVITHKGLMKRNLDKVSNSKLVLRSVDFLPYLFQLNESTCNILRLNSPALNEWTIHKCDDLKKTFFFLISIYDY